ncbi:MAG: ATP-binding protein [Clostridia bacterium]|nr:ATP-binding protein [Clostridia bacterium]
MKDQIKFTIPGKPDYVKMVRVAIASVAANVGFSVEEIEDIKVAVSEACKSVTCHGHEGFSTVYNVTCEPEDGGITIVVVDEVGTYEIIKDKKPCANCPGEGNLSLFVIESLMDKVEIKKDENGNKSIRMVKYKC